MGKARKVFWIASLVHNHCCRGVTGGVLGSKYKVEIVHFLFLSLSFVSIFFLSISLVVSVCIIICV
ncbi:hypothetical protein QBC41DRAFT_323071 [Cercophora samala]|uniref:Uncharacterized protein n=1 Tax=Cercophora samala TaxID=330535 RepID=A0AA39ZBI1_9PEZI|nr:hypothetical protein QBC41DRAFT_323071 [Cercophora samala]